MKEKTENIEKKSYEKPRIVFDEKIEVLAGACGALKTEKQVVLQPNPTYGTPCKSLYS